MTVTDAQSGAIFGQITVDDMRANSLLIRAVLPLLREACKFSRGTVNADQVFDGLIAGDYSLWGVMRPPATLEAVIVTRVLGQVFDIMVLGPDFAEALAFVPRMAGEARSKRCERMRVTGPKFWRDQHLPDFHVAACVLEKDLSGSADQA